MTEYLFPLLQSHPKGYVHLLPMRATPDNGVLVHLVRHQSPAHITDGHFTRHECFSQSAQLGARTHSGYLGALD